jgi:Hemerythrin HHE cation binding domain
MRIPLAHPVRATLNRQSFNRTKRLFSYRIAAMSTISDTIIKDHRELEQYYNQIVSSTDHDHQERFGNQFTWELARHSVGEELVVYPAFERYLGSKGEDMAENDRKEHRQVSNIHSCMCRTQSINSFLGEGAPQAVSEHEARRPKLCTETEGALEHACRAH